MSVRKRIIVIDPKSVRTQYWRDLWSYRDLLYFLSWRDILVRYKQTIIGVAWAVVRPVLTMLIFTFVFGRLANLPSGEHPYSALVFAAMLPWYFFAGTFSEAANSLLANSNMISKVYFPRLLVPLSSVAVCLVDFAISFVIMFILMAWYGISPTVRLVTLPAWVILTAATALGPALWCAALNVRFRDFRYIIPFVTQIGLYISPVGFVSSIVPERWKFLYYMNPMAAVIDGFRWSLSISNVIYWPGIAFSVGVVVFLLMGGVWYFRRTEDTFADII